MPSVATGNGYHIKAASIIDDRLDVVIGDPEGALYGVQKDYKSPARSMINSNTKVSNLFLTGQNLILHGIVGVTIGAFVTCFNFVNKEKLISKINHMSKAGEEVI